MKFFFRPYRDLFIPLFFLAAGCHSAGSSHPISESAILESPLLIPINDSIRKFPNQAGLYFRRAVILSQNNAHEAAEADFRKSWALQPSEETALQFASNLTINNKPAEKRMLLEDAVARFPASKEIKRLLGEAYQEAGSSAKALEWYNQLLSRDPADFETWYEKGRLLLELKDTMNAVMSLKKAYALQPVNTYGLELAHIYAEKGNPESISICDEILHADSARELVDPFFIKGIYYGAAKQYELALVQYDSCIRRDWKFTDAYIEKGIVFFKQKNYDEALHTFRMAATVSNTYPDAYYWMGRCYEVINKKQQARINYERAIALDKNFTEAKTALKRLKS